MAKKAVGSLKDVTRKAVSNHKDDEVDYGSVGNMPGGVRNGVAQLATCGFQKIKSGRNEGQWAFRASGIATEPEKNDRGEQVAGLYTSVFIPICDTTTQNGKTTTLDEHISDVLQELKKLGLDTAEYSDDELEQMAADILEEKPYFKFTTRQADNSDRVWENWRGTRGVPEDYEPPGGDGIVDETEDSEEEEEEEAPKSKRRKRRSSKKEEAATSDDPMELAQAADAGDDESQKQLENMCDEAGIDPEDDAYDSWEDVAKVLTGEKAHEDDEEYEDADDEEAAADDEDEEGAAPEKGDVYKYKPPRANATRDMEVTAVFTSKETVNLKDLESEKRYKGVAWGALQ